MEAHLPGMFIPAKPREVLGHILQLPFGVTAVPYEARGEGWWAAVVIASEHDAYPVGGYNLTVSPHQVEQSTDIVPVTEYGIRWEGAYAVGFTSTDREAVERELRDAEAGGLHGEVVFRVVFTSEWT